MRTSSCPPRLLPLAASSPLGQVAESGALVASPLDSASATDSDSDAGSGWDSGALDEARSTLASFACQSWDDFVRTYGPDGADQALRRLVGAVAVVVAPQGGTTADCEGWLQAVFDDALWKPDALALTIRILDQVLDGAPDACGVLEPVIEPCFVRCCERVENQAQLAPALALLGGHDLGGGGDGGGAPAENSPLADLRAACVRHATARSEALQDQHNRAQAAEARAQETAAARRRRARDKRGEEARRRDQASAPQSITQRAGSRVVVELKDGFRWHVHQPHGRDGPPPRVVQDWLKKQRAAKRRQKALRADRRAVVEATVPAAGHSAMRPARRTAAMRPKASSATRSATRTTVPAAPAVLLVPTRLSSGPVCERAQSGQSREHQRLQAAVSAAQQAQREASAAQECARVVYEDACQEAAAVGAQVDAIKQRTGRGRRCPPELRALQKQHKAARRAQTKAGMDQGAAARQLAKRTTAVDAAKAALEQYLMGCEDAAASGMATLNEARVLEAQRTNLAQGRAHEALLEQLAAIDTAEGVAGSCLKWIGMRIPYRSGPWRRRVALAVAQSGDLRRRMEDGDLVVVDATIATHVIDQAAVVLGRVPFDDAPDAWENWLEVLTTALQKLPAGARLGLRSGPVEKLLDLLLSSGVGRGEQVEPLLNGLTEHLADGTPAFDNPYLYPVPNPLLGEDAPVPPYMGELHACTLEETDGVFTLKHPTELRTVLEAGLGPEDPEGLFARQIAECTTTREAMACIQDVLNTADRARCGVVVWGGGDGDRLTLLQANRPPRPGATPKLLGEALAREVRMLRMFIPDNPEQTWRRGFNRGWHLSDLLPSGRGCCRSSRPDPHGVDSSSHETAPSLWPQISVVVPRARRSTYVDAPHKWLRTTLQRDHAAELEALPYCLDALGDMLNDRVCVVQGVRSNGSSAGAPIYARLTAAGVIELGQCQAHILARRKSEYDGRVASRRSWWLMGATTLFFSGLSTTRQLCMHTIRARAAARARAPAQEASAVPFRTVECGPLQQAWEQPERQRQLRTHLPGGALRTLRDEARSYFARCDENTPVDVDWLRALVSLSGVPVADLLPTARRQLAANQPHQALATLAHVVPEAPQGDRRIPTPWPTHAAFDIFIEAMHVARDAARALAKAAPADPNAGSIADHLNLLWQEAGVSRAHQRLGGSYAPQGLLPPAPAGDDDTMVALSTACATALSSAGAEPPVLGPELAWPAGDGNREQRWWLLGAVRSQLGHLCADVSRRASASGEGPKLLR